MTDVLQAMGIEPPKVEASVAKKPVDVLDAMGITPPSINEMNTNAINSGVNLTNPIGEIQKSIADTFSVDQEKMLAIAKTRFTPEQIDKMQNTPIGFFDAWKKIDGFKTPFVSSVKEAKNLFNIYELGKKFESGETLSEPETQYMNDFLDSKIQDALTPTTLGGKLAYGLSDLPSFMVEFAAMGGVGKFAQKGAMIATEKAISNTALKKITGGVAATTAASIVMAPRVAEKFGERRVSDSMNVTDKGELVLKESQESPAKSALMAVAYTATEVASEYSGALIGKYFVSPIAGKLSTPLISAVNKLPTNLKNGLYEAYKKINPNAQVSKVFTNMGFNGMIAELGEERINDVMNASLGLLLNDQQAAKDKTKYTAQDYLNAITPSSDQLLVEAGLVSIVKGVNVASDMTFNILKNKGIKPEEARTMTDAMTVIEKENFVNQNLEYPKSDYQNVFKDETQVDENPALPKEQPSNYDGTFGIYKDFTDQQNLKDPPPINNEQSLSDKFIKEFRDDLYPINKLGEIAKERGLIVDQNNKKFSDIELKTRMYSSVMTQTDFMINHNTFLYDEKGNAVNTGKGLKRIVDDFDNYFVTKEPDIKARRKDFTDYLVAKRYINDLETKDGVKVTEAQKVKSRDDLSRLAAKYGSDIKFVETFSQEIYQYQKNVLARLVKSGVMSQEMYNDLTTKNSNYIPFNRVIKKEWVDRISAGSKLFSDARVSKVIKKLEGSELDIVDPFQSIILNTAKINALAMQNEVAGSIAKMAEVLPDYVQKKKPVFTKLKVSKVFVAYDKKLRSKLEKAIEIFSNNLEVKNTLNQKGNKGFVLGSYSPEEKMVRLRAGAGDKTLTHEVGHLIDFSIDLGNKMFKKKGVKEELTKLAEERMKTETIIVENSDGTTSFEDIQTENESQKFISYLKNDREIIANFYDAYVNAPHLLDKLAPKAKKEFEKIIDETPALNFIKEIKPSLERDIEKITTEVWAETKDAPKDTITYYNKGKKEYYKVSKPILETMKNLHPAQVSLLDKFVMPIMSLVRATATLNPEFMLRSIPREALNTFITNRDVRVNIKDYANGVVAVLSDAMGIENDLYQEFTKSAKFNSYMELNEENVLDEYSQFLLKDGNIVDYIKAPIKMLEKIGMRVDQFTRVGVFNAAKRAGFSDIEASLVSRDVFDYSRGGSKTKEMNKHLLFFKAGVNGTDKLYRAFKERPVESFLYAFATVTLPSIAITSYYLYYAPDDERKEYIENNESLRSMFWFFKANGEWVRVPKPFQIGNVFGSVPEQFMVWGYQQDKPEFKQMAGTIMKNILSSALPVSDESTLIPLTVKIPVEWTANYNFFFGNNIYPSFLDGKDPNMRYNSSTTETAKQIGNLLNVSPAKVDNTIRSIFTGSTPYVTAIPDYLIKQAKEFNGQTVPEKPVTPSDMMIIRAFAQRRPAGFRSNSYRSFDDNFDTVSQRHTTFESLDGAERAEYAQKHSVEISMYKTLGSSKKQISKIGKEINSVVEHKTMTSEEKVSRINDLEDQITNIAREANKLYNERMRGSE